VRPPDWLDKENPNWKGNFKVRYWHKDWQDIILNKHNGYLQKIIQAGFNGVYLDIIDAFEYYE
jgi:cysteinyl-tRNA synthetase